MITIMIAVADHGAVAVVVVVAPHRMGRGSAAARVARVARVGAFGLCVRARLVNRMCLLDKILFMCACIISPHTATHTHPHA